MSAKPLFSKVLIANRGEIAVRIARTLRQMGIASVAIYSEADRDAAHVLACDEAYPVGPATAAQSYLNQAVLLEVAKGCGAQAIHPGYGFLSENAAFAQKVADAGLTFIGPPPSAMRIMGSKTGARSAMKKAGVPCVPGSDGPLNDLAEAQKVASAMGYPVMLKASAGGGGKGMRLVHSEAGLAAGMRAAASEAQNAFGDPTVYLEKAILNPRHIEIQVFSDAQGETFFIGERECSMQRRHQKVIEEAPSPILDHALRGRMGEVACQAARAVNYRGAGTIEFLMDEARNFYFLEMNTRLQVEHPVTELCYGVDLVQAQVRVAAGAPLHWRQEQFVPRGHAIEARLYAEDADANFMPCPGRIEALQLPHGPGIRVDAGVLAGYEVPRYYDAMIAKVVAWGEDREQARQRLRQALENTRVQGIVVNVGFLLRLLDSRGFIEGAYHTGSIAEVQAVPLAPPKEAWVNKALAAAAIAAMRRAGQGPQVASVATQSRSSWRRRGWREGGA